MDGADYVVIRIIIKDRFSLIFVPGDIVRFDPDLNTQAIAVFLAHIFNHPVILRKLFDIHGNARVFVMDKRGMVREPNFL